MDIDPTDLAILRTAEKILLDAPEWRLPLGELVAQLLDEGVLDLDDIEGNPLHEVDEILALEDTAWTDSDDVAHLNRPRLDRTVLTHRVTAEEIDRDELDLTVDFGELDLGLAIYDRTTFEPGHGEKLTGPAGWLDGFAAGDLIAWRRVDGDIAVEKVGEARLASGKAEAAALRAAFEANYVEGVGVDPFPLFMNAISSPVALFTEPVPPISELLEGAGLTVRDGFVGRSGEEFRPPGVIARERNAAARRVRYRFDRCCEAAFDVVDRAYADLVLRRWDTDPPDLPAVGAALAHGNVASAFIDGAIARIGGASDNALYFADAVVAAAPGEAVATARYLRAMVHEWRGDIAPAEADFGQALAADPHFAGAAFHVARYASDRGDARRALSLFQRVGADLPIVEVLEDIVHRPYGDIGRNDPCPCGSGRKFKHCHLRDGALPLSRRAAWVLGKLTLFAELGPNRDVIDELIETAAESAGAAEDRLIYDPIFVDIAVFEGGLIDRFLLERGSLLPADEVDMLGQWAESPRRLWEVTDTDPGQSITLRDTRTGDAVTVAERTASRSIQTGMLVLARVVPAGTELQIVSDVRHITVRQRESVMAVLDDGGDAEMLASWFGWTYAPPELRNREGEPLVLSEVTLRPSLVRDDLIAALDGSTVLDRYGDEPQWTQPFDVDGETIVRAAFDIEGDHLVVRANSLDRLDGAMAIVRDVDPDAEVIEEERKSGAELYDGWRRQDRSPPEMGDLPATPPELQHALDNYIKERERRWVDEPVPALGGLTPRQALDDPTRPGGPGGVAA